MARPISNPAPAASAAGPMAANTPAPIIDPRPITTASPSPSRLASRVGAGSTSAVVRDQLDLESARLGEVRGVHAGEVSPVGRFGRVHPGTDQLLVGGIDVLGLEAEVAEVHVG